MDEIESPPACGPIPPAPPETTVAGWAVSGRRSAAALRIADCTALTKVVLRAPENGGVAERVGVGLGRAAESDHGGVDTLTVGVGPGEWLVLGPPGAQAAVTATLEGTTTDSPDGLATVVDVTHGRALLRVSGAAAAELLAVECAVDASDRACPNGSAFRSEMSGVLAEVTRHDRDEMPSYLVGCEWTLGRHLFDALCDSGAQFDIDVEGYVDLHAGAPD